MPLRMDELLENLSGERLLVLRVEVTLELGLGGVPVVADARPEEAELRMNVVPREADLLPLTRRQRGVEGLGERLGGARRRRLGRPKERRASEEAGAPKERRCCRQHA